MPLLSFWKMGIKTSQTLMPMGRMRKGAGGCKLRPMSVKNIPLTYSPDAKT